MLRRTIRHIKITRLASGTQLSVCEVAVYKLPIGKSKVSLGQAIIFDQLSCNSCPRLTRTRELMKLSCKLSLVSSRATLVLVWPGHESWWNSHVNSRLSTLMQLLFSFDQDTRVDETLMQTLTFLSTLMQLLFSFDQDMRVDETLMQTLACQLSCNSCSRLTRTWELMKLSCKLSLVNSATLVLVWPAHESWWNSHVNSRLSTLMQLLFSFDQDMKVDETLM